MHSRLGGPHRGLRYHFGRGNRLEWCFALWRSSRCQVTRRRRSLRPARGGRTLRSCFRGPAAAANRLGGTPSPARAALDTGIAPGERPVDPGGAVDGTRSGATGSTPGCSYHRTRRVRSDRGTRPGADLRRRLMGTVELALRFNRRGRRPTAERLDRPAHAREPASASRSCAEAAGNWSSRQRRRAARPRAGDAPARAGREIVVLEGTDHAFDSRRRGRLNRALSASARAHPRRPRS